MFTIKEVLETTREKRKIILIIDGQLIQYFMIFFIRYSIWEP